MEEEFSPFSGDPRFLSQVVDRLNQSRQREGLSAILDLEKEAFLSSCFDLSMIQESVRFRFLRRARLMADFLIDESAELNSGNLDILIEALQNQGHIFYPKGYNDGPLTAQSLSFLIQLKEDGEIAKSLRRFQLPLCNSLAEDLIRQTLGIHPTHSLNNSLVRMAVLTACLFPLRQNVGSCFATAPAILIQHEQIDNLLEDLHQLLLMGKLKRIFDGVEYSVPLCPSTGIGDLRKKINSGNSERQVFRSPGLIAAFEAAGLLSNNTEWEKKVESLHEILSPYLESSFTIEEVIHEALLRHYQVTDEDLQAADRWERELMKISKLSAVITPERGGSKKIEASQQVRLKEKRARAAFNGVCDNALLKAWEFTLASYSEIKMEFSRWNLYMSLGLHHEEAGGIGEVIYQRLNSKIQEANQKLEQYQREYEIAFDQVRGTELLLKQAGSESEVRRLRTELQSRSYHARMCLEMRDQCYSEASRYSSMFSFLVKQYDSKFPEYFQEVYDPEMHEAKGALYDDSPAGFRLVYKHGRNDLSQWTLVYTAEQYINALVDFFLMTESPIASACEWEGGDKEVLEITSAIILHIRSETFLQSALLRMKKAHRESGEQGDRTPWSYTSGGAMTTLLKTYYCRPGELTNEGQWVENETELLIFLVDTLKNLSPSVTNAYLKDPSFGMLISSPSHAFSLQPGRKLFREGWQESGFTYTWVRDQVFQPSHQFYSAMKLNSAEQTFLVDEFSNRLPPLAAHHLHRSFSPLQSGVSVISWRKALLDRLEALLTPGMINQKRFFADAIDAFLFEALPLIPGEDYKIYLKRLFSDRMDEKVSEEIEGMANLSGSYLTAKSVKESAKAAYLLAHGTTCLSFDLHDYIAQHARFISLAAPSPLIFADTNWVDNYFAFVSNPGTGRLELWRVDPTATEGHPMSAWQHWINGTERNPWIVFTKPSEYSVKIK